MDENGWTPERVGELRALVAQGLTAAAIAAALGGTTRNAVIGKAHRLKLSLRAKAVAVERTRAKLAVVPPAFHAEPVTLIDMRACHCRWPLWGAEKPEPERAFYCGGFAPVGRAYCDAHHARAAGRALADGEKARAA